MEQPDVQLLDPAGSTPSESSASTQKAIKRKFEQAIQNLDIAVGPSTLQIPGSTKRPKIGRSLYSTLAKYGIHKESKASPDISNLEGIAKSAPHFAAVLSRSMSRSQKATPLKFTPSASPNTPSPGSDYRPSSTASFISRLATFKLTTYANKPPAIDAVAAAKCGWINDRKDRLVCGICASSWVVAGTSGLNRDAANALVEKQRVALVENHKNGCPWKTRQCDASIYRVSFQMPSATVKELKARAIKLDPVMKDVQIKHPLTTTQIQQYLSILRSVRLPNASGSTEELPLSALDVDAPGYLTEQEPGDSALLAALFGWSIVVPSEPERLRRTASRGSSVALSTPARLGLTSATPARNSFPSIPISRPSLSTISPSSPRTSDASIRPKADVTLLFCSLCQRRVGLWAFLPSNSAVDDQTPIPSGPSLAGGENQTQPRRQLDILKEHRSYCPYVVRSTVVPTLPVSTPSQPSSLLQRPFSPTMNPSSSNINALPGALEGWRAVLSIVLRHGLAQRQRLGRKRSHRGSTQTPCADKMDGDWVGVDDEASQVDNMIESVKTRGGKDLLKYVKGLLG